MSLRQGPDRDAVNYDEAVAAGFVLPADRIKPAPATVAQPTFDHVIPTGAFASRTAAETRAITLMRKAKIGVSMFAVEIKGTWCIVRSQGRNTEYLEG
jgi:hypothetical protein